MTNAMTTTEERGLRPEEAAFGLFLLFIAATHFVLRQPFYMTGWLAESWRASYLFRAGIASAIAGLAIVAVGFALAGSRGRAALCRAGTGLRDFLPFIFMFVIYESIHALGPKVHGHVFDGLLIKADQTLFGCDAFVDVPLAIFEHTNVRPITYYFAFCYSGVFIAYWGLAIYFFFSFSRRVFRKYMLSIVLTSFLGYCGYMVAPTIGPYEYLVRSGQLDLGSWSRFGGAETITLFAEQIRSLHFDKMPACDGFPSLHTAWTLIVLGFCLRHASWLLWLAIPWAVGTIMGALYFQQHYMIDIVAGLPAAIVGTALAAYLVDGRVTGRVLGESWLERTRLRITYSR